MAKVIGWNHYKSTSWEHIWFFTVTSAYIQTAIAGTETVMLPGFA